MSIDSKLLVGATQVILTLRLLIAVVGAIGVPGTEVAKIEAILENDPNPYAL